MYYNKLEQQRKIISKEKRRKIVLLCLELVFFAIFVWGAFRAVFIALFALLFLIFLLRSIKSIVSMNRLLKDFQSIAENKLLNKTCSIKLSYPKITLLQHQQFPSRLLCCIDYYFFGLVIIDQSKNKYYYFFDNTLLYNKKAIDEIKSRFSRELVIECYANTSIVKSIEKDPLFIRIRCGELCD